jgi:cob(I)alamin adenosyltransferase
MEPGEMDVKVHDLRSNLINLEASLLGNPAKRMVGEKTKPTVNDRLFSIQKSIEYSTYGPTETNKQTLVIVKEQLNELRTELDKAKGEMSEVSRAIIESGAPWVEGEALPPIGPNRQ